MTVKAPKKMIKVNGIMKLNPEYQKWKAMQGAGGDAKPSSAPLEAQVAATDATGVPMVAAAYIDDSERQQSAPVAAGYNTPSSVVAIAHPQQQQQQHHEPMSTVPAPNQSNNGPPQGYASPHNHGNYPPPQQQHTPAFAGQRPPQYHLGKFGLQPRDITCPSCHRQGRTRTHEVIGSGTIVAIVILLFFFWPLFWLPLVIPDCKQLDHHCPHCGTKVGEKPPSCCC